MNIELPSYLYGSPFFISLYIALQVVFYISLYTLITSLPHLQFSSYPSLFPCEGNSVANYQYPKSTPHPA